MGLLKAVSLISLLPLFVTGQIVKSLGINSGVSISNQEWVYKSINRSLETNTIIGGYVSLYLEFLTTKHFSIRSEIGFCQKGNAQKVLLTTAENPEPSDEEIFKTRFNYFQFSPIFRLRKEFSHFIPSLLLGMRLDYKLSYTSDFDFTPIENNFEKTIYGISAGVGFEYKMNSLGFLSELQYQHDLSKLMDVEPFENNTGREVTNSAISISLGVKYYFSKKEKENQNK